MLCAHYIFRIRKIPIFIPYINPIQQDQFQCLLISLSSYIDDITFKLLNNTSNPAYGLDDPT